jgi:hypothetical protein
VITGLTAIVIQVLRRLPNLPAQKWFPAIRKAITMNIEIPGGIKLQSAKVHQLLLETDVL